MSSPVTLTTRALLLDMDGTLVDSTALVEEIWTMLAVRFGHDPADLLRRIHGVRAADSVARFAPAGSDVPALLAELDRLELDGSPATVEIPGARELVAALPAGSHALVTSAGRELARARLTGAGVRVPDLLVTAEDVANGKPHRTATCSRPRAWASTPRTRSSTRTPRRGSRRASPRACASSSSATTRATRPSACPACATTGARRSRCATGSSRSRCPASDADRAPAHRLGATCAAPVIGPPRLIQRYGLPMTSRSRFPCRRAAS